jgi:HEAT repeat protein
MDQADWTRLIGDLLSYTDDVNRAVSATTALGEAADESRLPELERLFRSGDYFLREVLGDPLARIKGLDALPLLLEGLTRGLREGHDHDGLVATITDLIQSHPSEAVPVLMRMLNSPSDEDRENAAWLLGFASTVAPSEPLIEALKDPSARVRANAVGSLGSFKDHPGVLERMLPLLRDSDEQVRVETASALGYFGDRRAEPQLREALRDPSERVRNFAKHALKQLRARSRPWWPW